MNNKLYPSPGTPSRLCPNPNLPNAFPNTLPAGDVTRYRI